MKLPFWSVTMLLLVLLSLPSTAPLINGDKVAVFQYDIESESKLYLEGSSNVVDFTCHCTHPLEGGELVVNEQSGAMVFEEGTIRLPVAGLDCGNRVMNKDMYEALAADAYPVVEIRLLEVATPNTNAFAECNVWTTFLANIQLTIAGVAKTVQMRVKGAHLGYDRYHFTGLQPIYLTDFGIDPPRPMLGAIRVDNCITINMDLYIRLATADR